MDEEARARAEADANADANANARVPSWMERLKGAPITVALTAINVAVFVLAELNGGTTNERTLLDFGAVEPLHVWSGEYWRVATCMFLHIGWIHILMNTYASFGWATALERAFGKLRFLGTYLLAGVAGGCASVVSGTIFTPHPSAGASGALFGIIGAILALRRRRMPSFAAFFADKPVRSILFQLAIWAAIGYQVGFDNAAHLGGFVIGITMAWLLTSKTPRLAWVAAAGIVMTLFVFAARPWWAPHGEHANDVGIYARSYLEGTSPHGAEDKSPWPKNVPRGLRFGEKGCASGLAYACTVLADHYDKTGEPTKAEPLHKRACELDPAACEPLH